MTAKVMAKEEPTDLSTRAMLVSLSMSLWGNRRLDKKISQEAAANHGMGDRVGRYNKWLLIEDAAGNPSKLYQAIVSARNAAAQAQYEQTLPWMDDGSRILTAANFIDWANIMREHKTVFEQRVNEFIAAYPALVQQTKEIMDRMAASQNKKSMFDARNYPHVSVVRRKFDFVTKVLPLPSASDFRVKLSERQVNAIREQVSSYHESIIMDSTQHLFERLGSVVERVKSLGIPKTGVRKSLAEDIRSVCAIARRLNISNDSYLNEFASRIEKELSFDADMLRAMPEERENIAARAEAIMSDMGAFMGIGGDDDEE